MADENEVQIRFTAATEEAEEGIANVHKALNGLAQSMSDVSGAAAGLRGAFTAALPTDKLADASKAFAGLGDQTARTAGQLREMGNAIRAADAAFNSTKQHLAAELKLHEITYDQETAALLAALDQRLRAEEEQIDGALLANERGTEGYDKAIARRQQIETKYFAERQRIVDQAAEHEAQEWKAVADQIAGAFNSQLQKLLAGTESWSQAMKKMSGDLILKFIQDQVKLTLEWLANQARILAGHIAAETGMTAATTTGAALRAAAQTASGQTSILETLANAFKAIFAGAGQTAAGVAAAVAPTTGPAAPAIGAAAGAAVAADAMGLADATGGVHDIGDWTVPSTGLALLHKNEVVLPERGGFAEGFRRAVSNGGAAAGMNGGGTTISPSINITAMDSRSVSRFFNDNAHHMVRALQRGLKGGAHLPLRSSMR
jgi:hypothetical protein